MAGIKLDNFSTSDVNLTAIMSTAQAMRNGHFALSLTEMDSTTIPQIAAGSIIDLNGTLIYFDADETIGGTPVDGVTYIKLIYSSGTVTAEWTATAPVFNTSLNGWYGTAGSSGHRYVAKTIKATANYSGKLLLDNSNIPYIYETQTQNSTGSWTAGATRTLTFTFSTLSTVVGITAIDLKTLSDVGIVTAANIESIVVSTNTVVITLRSNGSSSATNNFAAATLTVAGY